MIDRGRPAMRAPQATQLSLHSVRPGSRPQATRYQVPHESDLTAEFHVHDCVRRRVRAPHPEPRSCAQQQADSRSCSAGTLQSCRAKLGLYCVLRQNLSGLAVAVSKVGFCGESGKQPTRSAAVRRARAGRAASGCGSRTVLKVRLGTHMPRSCANAASAQEELAVARLPDVHFDAMPGLTL